MNPDKIPQALQTNTLAVIQQKCLLRTPSNNRYYLWMFWSAKEWIKHKLRHRYKPNFSKCSITAQREWKTVVTAISTWDQAELNRCHITLVAWLRWTKLSQDLVDWLVITATELCSRCKKTMLVMDRSSTTWASQMTATCTSTPHKEEDLSLQTPLDIKDLCNHSTKAVNNIIRWWARADMQGTSVPPTYLKAATLSPEALVERLILKATPTEAKELEVKTHTTQVPTWERSDDVIYYTQQ